MPDDDPSQPAWFAALRILCIIGVIVLALFDLTTLDTEVPEFIYGILGGLAGGPELAKLRGEKSGNTEP